MSLEAQVSVKYNSEEFWFVATRKFEVEVDCSWAFAENCIIALIFLDIGSYDPVETHISQHIWVEIFIFRILYPILCSFYQKS
jgi:hypothetical protein